MQLHLLTEKGITNYQPLSPSHANNLTYMKKHLEKECIILMDKCNCCIFQTKPSLYFIQWALGVCSSLHWKSQHARKLFYQNKNSGSSSSEVEKTDVGGFP